MISGVLADSARVDIYDSVYQTWTMTTLSIPRARLSAAATGCKAIFLGGMILSVSVIVTANTYIFYIFILTMI